MSLEREIAVAVKNARASGYQEIRIDLKTEKITPLKRGPGFRVEKKHVTITRIVGRG